ncbi:MAG: hypothetical protein U0T36_03265 [Saprospiraceae bacterium]
MAYRMTLLGKNKQSTFRIISEIYYKKLSDMVSYELDNARIRYVGVNNLLGTSWAGTSGINGEFVPQNLGSTIISASKRSALMVYNILTVIDGDSSRVVIPVNDVPRPTDQLMTLNMFFQDYLPKMKMSKST